MTSISLSYAETIVENNKAALPLPSDQAREDYVSEFKKILSQIGQRSPEDYRQAATMAVDASKSLLQIAIAVFVAMGGFMQFASNAGLDWDSLPVIFFAIAAALAFVSMCAGFFAIGDAFKRGEGRIGQQDPNPWSTKKLKNKLMFQSSVGVLALLSFATAIVGWNIAEFTSNHSLTISDPQKSLVTQSFEDSITLEGEWSKLIVKQEGHFALDLGVVPQGESRAFSITVK